MPCRQRKLVLALCGLALTSGAREARANMGAREFFTDGTGSGALTAPGTDKIRVREILLHLDFRESGRQASTAQYLLVNLHQEQAWEDELIFVSTAATVTVTVDDSPVQVKAYGNAFPRSERVQKDLGQNIQGNGFRVRLLPGQESRIAVRFLCAPGKHEHSTFFDMKDGGLLRLDLGHKPSLLDETHFFSYPLWPAYGFAGGTGEMAITLLTGPGALPPTGTDQVEWSAQPLATGDTRWTIRLPAATTVANAPLRQVRLEYPQPRPSRWHLGASAFAGLRFAGKNEDLASPHLAISADLIIDGIGAFMLGGESEFTRSASLSLAFQQGPANPYVSAYVGGAVLATFGPEVTPGIELRAGARAVYIPLDLVFQLHPWVTPGEGHVARWRLIVGFRAGVW